MLLGALLALAGVVAGSYLDPLLRKPLDALSGSSLSRHIRARFCVAFFFPRDAPAQISTPYFSSESDAVLETLVRLPIGGNCVADLGPE